MTKLFKTITFLGSDKNAGKTTAFLYYLNHCDDISKLILTSIGINGESIDEYEKHSKPQIFLAKNQKFITKHQRLLNSQGQFKILNIFNQPKFKDTFVLAQTLIDSHYILEGPNDKKDILLIKNYLQSYYPNHHLLIDGSIDRQFLCDPKVSNEVYYSLLISERKVQRDKAKQFLLLHNFKKCNWSHKLFQSDYKTIFFDKEKSIIYKSKLNANFDTEMIHHIKKTSFLFLNCALSHNLLKQIKNIKLTIILENPSLLVSNLSNELIQNYNIQLLNKAYIKKVFIKEDKQGFLNEFSILNHYSFHNLFQEEHHAIRL
ncbi:MAG: hypothetical protein COB02_05825 [Candidatus Cloacimonadota bacterium]|nr:MAG: hypothetical protein COB02_05825 [Candidatus Cloacimonadota bacterium]